MAAPSPLRAPEPPPGSLAPLLAIGLLVAAYSLLSHWLMLHYADRAWTVAALFGPLLLGIAAGGWQRRHGLTLAGCAALAGVLALVVLRGGVGDTQRLYVLQHAGLHAVGAWTFASTLRPGGTPLITALAQRVHRDFSPAMRLYTGRLTRAWAVYFVAMIGISLAIYALAPWSWWSAYCNLITPLAALGFFVGEHLLRYRLHPEFERVSLQGAWQAWRSWPGTPGASFVGSAAAAAPAAPAGSAAAAASPEARR